MIAGDVDSAVHGGGHAVQRHTDPRIARHIGDALGDFWIKRYVPELLVAECARSPAIERIVRELGGVVAVSTVPIPCDCIDGFSDAFCGGPEAFLDDAVRRAQSAWTFLPEGVERRFVTRLADDLQSGAWDREYGHWRNAKTFDGALRLVVSRPR